MRIKVAMVIIVALVAVSGTLALALSASSDNPISAGTTQLDTDQNPVAQAPFPVNPNRFDPYKQFKFKVKWDGKYVPNIITVSGLIRDTEVVINRDGGEPNIERRSPGLTSFEPIVIERGRTHDTAFEDWADKVFSMNHDVSLADFRKDIIIELYNEAGQKVMAWMVYRCWPSEYIPLAGFDANNVEVAIEAMTLQHEGWERDLEVTEPVEPSFP